SAESSFLCNLSAQYVVSCSRDSRLEARPARKAQISLGISLLETEQAELYGDCSRLGAFLIIADPETGRICPPPIPIAHVVEAYHGVAVHLQTVSMGSTRGDNSPKCHSTFPHTLRRLATRPFPPQALFCVQNRVYTGVCAMIRLPTSTSRRTCG